MLAKLGAEGSALFVEGEEPIKQPAIMAPKVLDTTGAGDTFTAAFAVALVEGKSKRECLRFAGIQSFRFSLFPIFLSELGLSSFKVFSRHCSCCCFTLCSGKGSHS